MTPGQELPQGLPSTSRWSQVFEALSSAHVPVQHPALYVFVFGEVTLSHITGKRAEVAPPTPPSHAPPPPLSPSLPLPPSLLRVAAGVILVEPEDLPGDLHHQGGGSRLEHTWESQVQSCCRAASSALTLSPSSPAAAARPAARAHLLLAGATGFDLVQCSAQVCMTNGPQNTHARRENHARAKVSPTGSH